MVVIDEPPDVAEKMRVPAEFDARFTVVPPTGAIVGFPNASCSWTVTAPRVALADAAPDTAADVITNLLAAAAEMMNVLLVAEVSPMLAAASV
jgi:hypothetical protein